MAVKTDVRILKTKEKLRQNLKSLLEKKSVDKIMVAELCNLAKVNRNTFYSHYEDINELFDDLLESETKAFLESMNQIMADEKKDVRLLNHCLLEEIRKNKRIYHEVFFSWRGEKFLTQLLVRYTNMEVVEFEVLDSKPNAREFFLFTIGGICSLIVNWLEHDLEEANESLENKIYFFDTLLDKVCRGSSID